MKLLLATLHSRYSHASLALPAIAASCADIGGLQTIIREPTVNEPPERVLAGLAAVDADVAAFSCYIWNIGQTIRLATELKLLNPGLFVVLGGPEVSYGCHELLAANPQIDAVVRGEGEETMAELLRLLAACQGGPIADEQLAEIAGLTFRSHDEIISTPDRPATHLDRLPSPFAAGLVAIDKPLVYFETSRGCPFSCAFCLSSATDGVRSYSPARIEEDLLLLMQHRVDTVKFVDRTFNYDSARARRIWQFILENNAQSRFHFEIAADLLTDADIVLLRQVPAGVFRFEIGVQTTHEKVLAEVERRTDLERLFANVARLRQETMVTIHLDLVAGLPGEDFTGFSRSLDRLLAAGPHHIQVEVLKLLKGTKLRRQANAEGYVFSPYPPYRTLKSRWLSYRDFCRIEETAAALEAFYNSGRFAATLDFIASQGLLTSLFTAGLGTANARPPGGPRLDGLFAAFRQLLANALPELAVDAIDPLRYDYCLAGYPGNDLPPFLRRDLPADTTTPEPPPRPEIAARLSLPPKTRFKAFTAGFARDYSITGHPDREVLITFVYCRSAAGEQVLTLAD